MHFFTDIIIGFWQTLAAMAPYLLIGFLAAGVLHVLISARAVERHLGKKGLWTIFKASIAGVPLPLCSCGVIPFSMSLHTHGASKGATASFLAATPQENIHSIFVTYSLLGPALAIFRPIAALVSGLVAGGLVELTETKSIVPSIPQVGHVPCGRPEAVPSKRVLRAIRHAFVTLPTDIGRSMLIGLAIAAFFSAALPEDFFAAYLAGGAGIVAMLVMLAAGIPVYVCATSSIPVVMVMMAKGLSPGAAMVFLMTGPATNAAALATLWGCLGRRAAIAYLVSIAVCALTAGLFIDQFLFVGGFDVGPLADHADMPGWLSSIGAVLLLVMLGFGTYRKSVKQTSN